MKTGHAQAWLLGATALFTGVLTFSMHVFGQAQTVVRQASVCDVTCGTYLSRVVIFHAPQYAAVGLLVGASILLVGALVNLCVATDL